MRGIWTMAAMKKSRCLILISNSYFPAAAACELGFFKAEGLDLGTVARSFRRSAYRALRDGEVDFVAGSAHSRARGFFRNGREAALRPGARHVLVPRRRHRRFNPQRGALDIVKGKTGRGALGRDGACGGLLIEAGYNIAARQHRDCAGAGCGGGCECDGEFRIDRGESAGRGHDRRLLGKRHGSRSRGDARHRYRMSSIFVAATGRSRTPTTPWPSDCRPR